MHEPSLDTLLHQYESAGLLTALKHKGLPPGWLPLQAHECTCGHDKDAVVLCRRTREDGDHGTKFVVWWVNMDLGGCFNGHYTDDEQDALVVYEHRRRQLK